ncbi:MAG: hypothetical protein AAF993_16545 [Pseudomonadota bacterium]
MKLSISVWTIISLALVWLIAGAYLMTPPQWSSKWSIVIPQNDSNARISLENMGQANLSSSGVFGLPGMSPTEAYKQFLLGEKVRNRAASALNISPGAFGKPRVTTLLQTSILQLEVRAESADNARQKAHALHTAFLALLEELRRDEIRSREISQTAQVSEYKSRVDQTERAILEFRSAADLLSQEQFDRADKALADLRERHLKNRATLANVESTLNSLAAQLGLSPTLAVDAFTLQSDETFQALRYELAEVSTRIPLLSKIWGTNHPELQEARFKFNLLSDAVHERSRTLVGHRDFKTLQLVAMADKSERADLYARLMLSANEVSGLKAEQTQLRNEIEVLDKSLRVDLREQSQLQTLEREHQLAEAVFVSALTQLDARRADVFAAYPMVQMLDEPNLPQKRRSPSLLIGVAGGLTGTIAVLITTYIIRIREKWLTPLLKNA